MGEALLFGILNRLIVASLVGFFILVVAKRVLTSSRHQNLMDELHAIDSGVSRNFWDLFDGVCRNEFRCLAVGSHRADFIGGGGSSGMMRASQERRAS